MNKTKTPRSAKARVRAYKKRSQYIATIIIVVILVVVIAIFGFLIYSYLNPSPNQTTGSTSQPKAAIVDHLSLTKPNQTFAQTATNILETAGYTVDYCPGEEVTVDFYRNLPTHDYGLIILRVHSALEGEQPPVALFTSESYDKNKHVHDQLTERVGIACIQVEGPYYFGIRPDFVRLSMNGRFQNTTIIMMGCNGLTYTRMAEAFIAKGAKAYISWSKAVSASHTDKVTTQLLKHLITEKQTIKQAVTETMKEVGSDPEHESILQYYPDTIVDNYIIPNIASNLILNDATISGYGLALKQTIKEPVKCM